MAHDAHDAHEGSARDGPGVWSASRGNTAWLYRQYCAGRAEDLGRLGRVSHAGSGA
jgi:hypothetical protein